MAKNIAVLGKGGREAMLTYKLKKSYGVGEVYVLPGNGGTEKFALNFPGIRLEGKDRYKAFLDFLEEKSINLVVSGSENELVQGIGDVVRLAGYNFFGVSSAAARFEGDKIFARDFMHYRDIPHPDYLAFDKVEEGIKYVKKRFARGAEGLFIKASGLCRGKGSIGVTSEGEASQTIKSLIHRFGEAGRRYLVERMLQGPEISATVLVDENSYLLFRYTQDYKPVGEGDSGPNTGGMGAVTLRLSRELDEKIKRQIIEPTIEGANIIGRPIKGVLYIAIMVEDNQPYVLEYNIRFGDPECQAFLPLVESDFLEAVEKCNAGKLHQYKLMEKNKEVAVVNMAGVGYPGDYSKSRGKIIHGLEEAGKLKNVFINQAGTKYDRKSGKILTNGSRVLNVIGLGDKLEEAVANAYKGVSRISADDEALFYRKDIGCNAPRISII